MQQTVGTLFRSWRRDRRGGKSSSAPVFCPGAGGEQRPWRRNQTARKPRLRAVSWLHLSNPHRRRPVDGGPSPGVVAGQYAW